MKSKNTLPVLFFIAALAITFACDSSGAADPVGSGELTVNGQAYRLARLYTDYRGRVSEGVYNFDLYLVSDELAPNRSSGVGEIVHLEMYFPEPRITSGTYPLSTVFPIPAPSFSDFSSIEIRWRAATDESDHLWWLTGGVVTISIDGPTYTINGHVDIEDDYGDSGSAAISFSGPIAQAFTDLGTQQIPRSLSGFRTR